MKRENLIFSQTTIFRALASRRVGVNIVGGYDFEKRRELVVPPIRGP